MNQILEPTSRASYGESIERSLEKIDGVITAPHCMLLVIGLNYLILSLFILVMKHHDKFNYDRLRSKHLLTHRGLNKMVDNLQLAFSKSFFWYKKLAFSNSFSWYKQLVFRFKCRQGRYGNVRFGYKSVLVQTMVWWVPNRPQAIT